MIRSFLLLFLCLAPAISSAKITRDTTHSFPVSGHPTILVDIFGGGIEVNIEPNSDSVYITLHQTFRTNDETEIPDILKDFEITIDEREGEIVVAAKRRRQGGLFSGWSNKNRASFSATVSCPPEVNLNLDTSGGSIRVSGFVEGDLRADTSGGSISVTGGTGYLNLDTSGGSISVDEAHGRIRADTSGGRISIGYVGPDVSKVNADTSGGGISIGLDPEGSYDLLADTSGGNVSVSDLEIQASKMSRTHVRGQINGGGTSVRADTSGGSILISAATR